MGIMRDKILLREWEVDQLNEHFKLLYDRRALDVEIFKKFQANGEIIKMTPDARDLTSDKNFWKTEIEIQEKAIPFINQLRRMIPYDSHNINPQTYDLKMVGDPNSKGK